MTFARKIVGLAAIASMGVITPQLSAQTTPAVSPPQAVTAPAQRTVKLNAQPNFTGLPIPRYVSLRHNRSFGRSGPSRGHGVRWVYERKGLPVIIVAETEMFRKVRDQNGDESWMHKSQLAGRRSAISLQEIRIFSKPRESAKIRAMAAKDTILYIDECDTIGWCKVEAKTGHKGFVKSKSIWGVKPLR